MMILQFYIVLKGEKEKSRGDVKDEGGMGDGQGVGGVDGNSTGGPKKGTLPCAVYLYFCFYCS